VRYDVHKEREVTTYVCMRAAIQHAQPVCQRVHGEALDAAMGDLLIELLTPLNLDVTLAIQAEVQARVDEADRLRQQHVERASHDAELARPVPVPARGVCELCLFDPDHVIFARSLVRRIGEARLHMACKKATEPSTREKP
jgi:hypothetical protein